MHIAFVKISSWFSAPRRTGNFGPTRCLVVWSSTFATAYKTKSYTTSSMFATYKGPQRLSHI